MSILNLSLIVGAGGFLGASARFLLTQWIGAHTSPAFPWSTFWINLAGSFALELLIGWSLKNPLSPEWRFFLSTGICGGFTTFSAFSAETLSLMQHGAVGVAGAYIVASVLGGVLAAALGYALLAR